MAVGGTVHIVQFEADLVGEAELIAQGNVADVMAIVPLHHVHRPFGSPEGMRAVPHQVEAVEVFVLQPFQFTIGTLAYLDTQQVAGRRRIGYAGSPGIAPCLVPVLRTKIKTDRRIVVLIAADVDDLLASRERPSLCGLIVKVHPIGSIEEPGIERCLVQTLTIAVAELTVDTSVHQHIEVTSLKSAVVLTVAAVMVVTRIVTACFHGEFLNQLMFLCLHRLSYECHHSTQGKPFHSSIIDLSGTKVILFRE